MKKTIPLALSLAALALTTAACGGDSEAGGEGGELEGLTGTIGSKDFSEQYILAHITGELLNAHGADVEVNTQLVGSANVRDALENGDFIGYWEYTGTSWITYNQQTEPITDPAEQFTAVKELDAKNDIAWLDPAPLNNTYAFAIRADKAEELGVTKLSDIAGLDPAEQTFCIESEFSTRDDGFPGLVEAYGIDVPEDNVVMLDTGVIYTATEKGDDCNFGEVFATDGRIKAMDLVVLEDDQKFFPVYQGALTLQAGVLEEHPEIADVIAEVSPLLTDEVMQDLNAKADVDGEDPEDIALDWLEEQGLLDG